MRAVGVISLAAMVTTSAAASASAQLRHPDGQPPRWTCSIIVLAVPAIDEAMRHPPPAGGDLSMPIREPDCVPSHVIPAPGSPRRAASPLHRRLRCSHRTSRSRSHGSGTAPCIP